MEKSLNVLKEELGTVRAGRANAALVDKVTVEYYGYTDTAEGAC